MQEPARFTLPPPVLALPAEPENRGRQQTVAGIPESHLLILGLGLVTASGSLAVETGILLLVVTQIGVLAALASGVLAAAVALLHQMALSWRAGWSTGSAGAGCVWHMVGRLLLFAGVWLGCSVFIAIVWAICWALF